MQAVTSWLELENLENLPNGGPHRKYDARSSLDKTCHLGTEYQT